MRVQEIITRTNFHSTAKVFHILFLMLRCKIPHFIYLFIYFKIPHFNHRFSYPPAKLQSISECLTSMSADISES